LREASLARRESLEEFQFLQANIDWFTARQEEKFISLNLNQRIERRDADKTFREQMDAQRKRLRENNFAFTEFLLTPPEDESADPTEVADESIETAAELNTTAGSAALADAETGTESSDAETDVLSTDEEPEPEGYARLDVHLREALRVIVDAVEIGNNPVYADHAPLTARPSSGG
jgi:carboxyl-terminal processing protease